MNSRAAWRRRGRGSTCSSRRRWSAMAWTKALRAGRLQPGNHARAACRPAAARPARRHPRLFRPSRRSAALKAGDGAEAAGDAHPRRHRRPHSRRRHLRRRTRPGRGRNPSRVAHFHGVPHGIGPDGLSSAEVLEARSAALACQRQAAGRRERQMADVRSMCAIGRRGQLGLNGGLPWEGNRGPRVHAPTWRASSR